MDSGQSPKSVVLNGENPFFDFRNTTLEGFVRDVTGDNTITYHDTNYIDYEGNNEYLSNTHSILDSLPSGWTQASWWAGGDISDLGDNGKCIDEITEYDRLLGITSASDEDKATALAKRDEALSLRLTGRIEECETLMQEAITLIPE